MLRYWMVFLIIGFFEAQAQEIKLSKNEGALLKENVRETALNSKTIVNEFVQLKHIDFLSNDIQSTGDLYFKSPDVIKWSYQKPYAYSVIFKDKKLYINDAGKKSDINLASNKVFKKLNDLIVRSVRGDMLDEDQFSMEFFKTGDSYLAKLSPKDKTLKNMFKEIQLLFDSQSFLVVSVKLMESSEDYTLINFKNKTINQPISDAIFAH